MKNAPGAVKLLLFQEDDNQTNTPDITCQNVEERMNTSTLRPYLHALVMAVSLGVYLPVQAMTNGQVLALAKSDYLQKNAAALAKFQAAAQNGDANANI